MGAETALIFGAVDHGDWRFLEPVRAENPLVICADGGVACARAAGFSPQVYVGDGDSGGQELPGGENWRLPKEKDVTDLQAAYEMACRLGCKRFFFTACTGGRQDHHLANLQLLERIWRAGGTAKILDPMNEIRVIGPGRYRLERSDYRYFSLLPITPKLEGLTITGAKYPLDRATACRGDSLTVSNELAGSCAELTLETGCAWLIRSEPANGKRK